MLREPMPRARNELCGRNGGLALSRAMVGKPKAQEELAALRGIAGAGRLPHFSQTNASRQHGGWA